MRAVSRNAIMLADEGYTRTVSPNTWVTPGKVYLHRTLIAKQEGGEWYVSPQGYLTLTTMERVNSAYEYLRGARPFRIKNGRLQFKGRDVPSRQWIRVGASADEVAPPPPPKRAAPPKLPAGVMLVADLTDLGIAA